MKLFDLSTKSSLAAILLAMAFMFQPGIANAQSRDETHPTPIAALPVTGNLGSGTYYYQLAEPAVRGGAATAVLDLTPPAGGGSMTVTFSGVSCCPPEAYIGVTTGLSDRMREATTFNISRAQPLLVTVYVSVGAKQTISFRLNFNNGAPTSSGVIVTPPAPSPTPPPTLPNAALCTDLGIDRFVLNEVGTDGLKKEITGVIRNLTTTHPYKGYRGLQWVEVLDITDPATPQLVSRIGFTIIDPGATFSYRAGHSLTAARSTRYEVKIRYSPANARDRSPYNDDCNTSNNSTRRQLISGGPVETLP